MTISSKNHMSGERVLALFTMFALLIAALGIALFWAMGVILLITGNGGQIQDALNTPGLRNAFFVYPVVLVIGSIVGWLAFWRKADLVALAAMAAPSGYMLLLYLYKVLIG
jgi:cytochrome bd-type quinol oxidase subunit 2